MGQSFSIFSFNLISIKSLNEIENVEIHLNNWLNYLPLSTGFIWYLEAYNYFVFKIVYKWWRGGFRTFLKGALTEIRGPAPVKLYSDSLYNQPMFSHESGRGGDWIRLWVHPILYILYITILIHLLLNLPVNYAKYFQSILVNYDWEGRAISYINKMKPYK